MNRKYGDRLKRDNTICLKLARWYGQLLIPLIIALALLIPSHRANGVTLTLEQALNMAMEQSPTIQQAKYNLEISELNLDAQNASLKSQFNLSVTPYSYSKQRQFDDALSQWIDQEQEKSSFALSVSQPIKWTDGTLSLTNDFTWQDASSDFSVSQEGSSFNNNLYLTLSQPFLTYNQTRLTSRELELDLENARLNYAIQKLELERQITEAFYDLYQAEQTVVINEEEFAHTQESYEIIKNKVDAGISAEEELYQAELNLANAQATVESGIVDLANTRDNFKILLGMSLSDSIEVIANIEKSIVKAELGKAVEKGLQYRMEIRQKAIEMEYARNDLVRTGANNEFKGSLDLSYGLIGTDSDFDNLYSSPSKSHQVAITLNVPIFDWGAKKARMKASEVQIESTQLNQEEEVKDIELSIRKAYRSLLNQETQVEIAEQNVRNAQLTYEINLERYRNGDLSSKEIGEYQTQLSKEKLNKISALINYRIALLNLKIQSLWDFQTDTPVLDSN